MAASKHARPKGRTSLVVAGGLLAGALATIPVLVLRQSNRQTPRRSSLSDAVRVLSDAEMKQVKAGWLEPKARKPRGRCPSCGDGDATCTVGASCGQSPDGTSPSLDATTAEASDRVHVFTEGSNTLTLGLTYSSHLADGTNTIIDTTMGSGWTHSYNTYLLRRGADFFWLRGNLEIVRFTNRGGSYTTSTGQFVQFAETGPDTAEAKLKNGTVYQFRKQDVDWVPAGVAYLVEAVVDPNQRATEFEYDAGGRVTNVTDSFGYAMGFEYNGDGKLTRVTATDQQALFEYESDTGQLSALTLPNGERTEYEYNHRGQMIAKTTPRGGTYRVDYSTQGRAYRLRDANGVTIASQSSTSNWEPDHETSLATGEMHYMPGTVTVTDGRGNQWQYEYDARGNITRTIDPDGSVSTLEYDAATLLVSRRADPNGHVAEYEYDALGNMTLRRDAEGNETTYEYEPVHNRLTRRVEPDGDEWHYVYDANGNLIEEIDPLIEEPDDATIAYEYYDNGLVSHRTDRNGNTTEWEYDAHGNVSKIIDPLGAETTFTYDAFGNVLTRTVRNDTDDQTTTYTYDARARVVTQTDPLGHTTRYDYDPDGNRTAAYTCWGDESNYRSVTRYEYDHRGRLTRTIEDDGGLNRTTQYQYDADDNQTQEINPNGVATEYEYDALNRLVRTVRDPGGLNIAWQYEYDPVGNQLAATDPNGHTTTYEYDVLNRQESITDALGNVTEYQYAPPGGGGGGCGCGTPGSSVIKCIIDAEGQVTKYEYDALDRRIKEVRQVGIQDCDADPDDDDVVTLIEYDPNGNVIAVIDPNGNISTSTYTPRDEIETVSNGCGETTAYVHDAAGNRIAEHPPNGNVISSEYDLRNSLVRVFDSLGDLSTYTYDCAGARETETDALGRATTYVYDNLDRLIQVSDPMGESAHYEYDAVGNQTRVVDRMGNQTVYEYDAANRQTAMKYWPDANGDPSVITRAYDATSNLLRIADANGNPTAYEYDALNRLVTETYADGTEWRFTYDGVGNQLTREDGMGEDDQPGNVTTYTYDELHRLIRRAYATGETDVFEYDKGGRLLTADNHHSHVGYTYDCADRTLTSTQTDLPQTYSYTVTYAYDVYANTRTLTYPSGKVVVETRDLRDRLHTVNADGEDVATYAYDLANLVLTKTFGNGTEARYAYNDNGWITELRHVLPDGTTTFAGFAHTYDTEGNRLSAQNLQETIPYDDAKPVTHSEDYAYDDIYRLIDYRRGQWVGGHVPNPRRQRDWQLDSVHNWEQFGIRDLDSGEDETYCNSINQMNEYDDPSTDGPPPVPDDDGLADDFMVPCPPSGPGDKRPGFGDLGGAAAPNRIRRGARDGGDTPTPLTGFNRAHDKNGNLVDDGKQEYFYDYQTDMTSALRSEDRLTMVKDKDTGELLGEYWYDALGRRIRKLAAGVSTIYVLTPGWREIEEYDDGTLARSYTFGSWIDEALTMDRAVEPDRFYYHGNALYSTLAITEETGTVVERYAYDTYAAPEFADADGVVLPEPLFDNPSLHSGRRYDDETGQYQYRTRYLDPTVGRFTTHDTIGIWRDRGALGNAYAYVHSSPTVRADPEGEDVWTGTGDVRSWGVLIGYRQWKGTLQNVGTKEKCDVEIECWRLGLFLGATIGWSKISFFGPRSGQDLKGKSESWGVEGALPGVTGAVALQPDSGLGGEGGIGAVGGLEIGAGYSQCRTTVIRCWFPDCPKPAKPSISTTSGGGTSEIRPPTRKDRKEAAEMLEDQAEKAAKLGRYKDAQFLRSQAELEREFLGTRTVGP